MWYSTAIDARERVCASLSNSHVWIIDVHDSYDIIFRIKLPFIYSVYRSLGPKTIIHYPKLIALESIFHRALSRKKIEEKWVNNGQKKKIINEGTVNESTSRNCAFNQLPIQSRFKSIPFRRCNIAVVVFNVAAKIEIPTLIQYHKSNASGWIEAQKK